MLLFTVLGMSLQRPEDRTHTVRLAMGNGLRADVWQSFQQRFGPIQILEIYGSTEGNIGFINYPGRCGALGKMSCFLRVSGLSGAVALIKTELTGPLLTLSHPPLRCCPPLSLYSLTRTRRSLSGTIGDSASLWGQVQGSGKPSLGVGRAGDHLLLRWNRLPKALRSVPCGGVCCPHLDPVLSLSDHCLGPSVSHLLSSAWIPCLNLLFC